jgi:hypothetical protein
MESAGRCGRLDSGPGTFMRWRATARLESLEHAGSLVSSRRADLDLAGRSFKLVLIESRREVIRQALLVFRFRFAAFYRMFVRVRFTRLAAIVNQSGTLNATPSFASAREKTDSQCLSYSCQYNLTIGRSIALQM